jgi:outer membrane lipoprotein-sorting protein
MAAYERASVLLAVLPALVSVLSGQPDATAIVRKADEHARGKTSYAELALTVVRPSWQREMGMKTWSEGTQNALVLIIAPAKEKGIVYLKRGEEVWNWIPSVERTIKMPPSMMSQSWMGTDFTNDDLVKESSIVADYTHILTGDSLIEGRACHKVIMKPKTEAAVVWGEVRLWVDKKDFLMLRAEYYDDYGELVNTMVAGDVQLLGGRLLPTRMEMIPADKPGHKTVIVHRSIAFDQPIPPGFFTTQNITRVK